MLTILLSAILLSSSVRAEEFNFNTGPQSGQQAILRIQRAGSQFKLYRCLAKSLSFDDINESSCERLGETDVQTLQTVANKFNAGQPLLPEETRGIFMLVVLSPIVKWGLVGVTASAMSPVIFMPYIGQAASRKVILWGISVALAGVVGYASYLAYIKYSETDGKRLLTQDMLKALSDGLESKIPDGQEFVQPLSAELWFYFAPSLFR